MSHTPGPWRWWACVDGSFKPGTDYAQIAAGPAHVAKVNLLGVSEDDLRLMVAAPLLLEALQAYLAWADPTICRDSELAAIREKSRAAIAVATGEQA